jgi:hypothetical protein
MFGMSQDEEAEDAALEATPRELGEEASHGVEPERRGWGEVERPAGMSRKLYAWYYGASATRGPQGPEGVWGACRSFAFRNPQPASVR